MANLKPDILVNLKTNLDKTLSDGFEALRVERESLIKAADLTYPKIEKVESVNPFNAGYMGNWASAVEWEMISNKGYYNEVRPTPEAFEIQGLKKVDDMYAKAEAAHLLNISKLESNKVLVDKLNCLMTQIEMPTSYSEQVYEKSRSKYGSGYKTHWNDAGYRGDIRRSIPTTDGWDTCVTNYPTYQKAIKDHATKMRQEIHDKKVKEEVAKRGSDEHQRQLAAAAEEVARLKEQLQSANRILQE